MNAQSLRAVPPVDQCGPTPGHSAAVLTGRASSTTARSNPTDWAARGRCVGRDPDELFVTGAAQRDAARLCSGCPVRLECLADALDNQIEFGVWGGLTERQRRALLRQRPDVLNWRELLEETRTVATSSEAS